MEQFLQALERVEEKSAAGGVEQLGKELRLSTRMRDSWKTGRFWFNYAARTCLDMDDIYWHALHDRWTVTVSVYLMRSRGRSLNRWSGRIWSNGRRTTMSMRFVLQMPSNDEGST